MRNERLDDLCKMILNSLPQEKTREILSEKIEIFTRLALQIFPEESPLTQDQIEYLKLKVFDEAYFKIDEEGYLLEDPSSVYAPWLDSNRSKINFEYWERYKKYLINEKKWNENLVNHIDEDSDKVLDKLGNPKDSFSWCHHGLLIGNVQAGKTANYTAIINKAVDAGYQVIIILTGTTEILRHQTQGRIDNDFVGLPSNHPLGDSGKYRPIGVGQIPPCTKIKINRFTSILMDFKTSTIKQVGMQLQTNTVSLFVLKKNKTVLNALSKWLADNNPTKGGKYDFSALIIDDEADNASINTRKEDEDPTAINQGIRSILAKFSRAAYLAVTATPFANIFINPIEDGDKNDDLFPSDFIYVLSLSPKYIGANYLFCEKSSEQAQSNLICFDDENNDVERFFPIGHKKDGLKVISLDNFPSSLVKAMRYFLLAQGILDLRPGINSNNRSMLVNVSRFTDIQNDIQSVINDWLKNSVQPSIRANYMKPEWANNQGSGEYYELKQVWDQFELEKIVRISWEEYSKKFLWNSVSKVVSIAVNQKNEILDYEDYPNGLRAIITGGNSLSRGMTLETLIVSYVYRNSKAYDTLMQMGRWFGYRDLYLDLYKVWMSSDSIEWYKTINEATNDLFCQIRRMIRLKQKPINFGLAVKRNPLRNLIVTAKNKSRYTIDNKLPTSVVGSWIETPRLDFDLEIIKYNNRIVSKFIYEVSEKGTYCKGNTNLVKFNRDSLWTNVPKDLIADLLESFKCKTMNMDYQAEPLAQYIRDDNNNLSWDVAVENINDTQDVKDRLIINYDAVPEPLKIACSIRTAENRDGILKIGRKSVHIASSEVPKTGLTNGQLKTIISRNPKGKSARDFLSIDNRKPLLVIFSMQVMLGQKKIKDCSGKWKEIVHGSIYPGNGIAVNALGLGFPQPDESSENESKYVMYQYNPVAIQQNADFADFFEEDGEDDE